MPDLISTIQSYGSPVVELYYGGQRLYPAPLINFTRQYNRNADDSLLSQEDTYILKGVYLNMPTGYYHVSVSGMESLKEIFSQDGLEFVIKAGAANSALASGTYIVSGIYPRITSISIPDRTDQNTRFDYEVTLVSKTAVSGVSGLVSSSSDSWQVNEYADDGSTRLVHRISAVGLNTASGLISNSLQNAKNFVHSRIGTGNLPVGLPAFCSPPSGFSSYQLYELSRLRNESFDSLGGSYEIEETFILISGVLPFTHQRTYEFSRDSDGIINVTLQGTVLGAGRTDGTNTPANGFYLALSGFQNNIQPQLGVDATNIYTSHGGSGVLAIGNPQSKSITENRFLGTVSYSITFTDDPGEVLPSGIAEQSLVIQRREPIALIASHAIPQRRLGNILQHIGTSTEGEISINVTVKAISTGDNVADTNTALAYAQTLINQNRPNPADFITLRLLDVSYSPDKFNLSVNAAVSWAFTKDIVSVPVPNADITFTPVV